MKTISAIAALSVVGALACDPAVQPEAPTPNFAGRGRIVESVTGAGNFTGPTGNFRTFSVSARRFADGSVTGEWECVNHVGDGGEAEFKSHGVVTCFTNIGSSVLMGGGSDRPPPNNEVQWHLVDNGPGATDQNSFQFTRQPPGFAARWCAGEFGLNALNDVTQGQITVR